MQSKISSCANDDKNSNKNMSVCIHNTAGNFITSNMRDSILKYSIIQQHWNRLHSEENSLRLQDAVEKFVFKKHFGDDGTLDVGEMVYYCDPLMY